MKRSFLRNNTKFILGMAVAASMLTACSNDDETEKIGNWISSTVFDGSPRSSSISFVIDNLAYVGTGYDGDNYLNDFWQYNIDGGYWVQKASVPGNGRSSAVAFTASGQGYVGTGYNGTDELGDFYKYDPATNAWTTIAPFAGTARRAAVAFNSDTHGYVGSGFDGENDKKDFWKYFPETNTWEEQFGFGGNKRREGLTFTIGTKVYFGTGSSNSINLDDFWSFDTNTEVWTKLTDLDDDDDYTVKRTSGTGFSIGNYGYVAGGDANTVWQYNPGSDTWTEKTNFEGASRQDAVAFSTSTRAFVTLGKYGNYYYDDMFEFIPFADYDDED